MLKIKLYDLNNDYKLELTPLGKLKDLIEKLKNENTKLKFNNLNSDDYNINKHYLKGLTDAYELIKNNTLQS